MRLVQPLADRGIGWLAARGIDPLHVVLAHGVAGLGAAALLLLGTQAAYGAAAALLVAKVLLDNMDGGLARATDRVTSTGRYVDTLVDFAGNVALFGALVMHGPPVVALAALVILTLVLSLDFNAERLYREARGMDIPPSGGPASRRTGDAPTPERRDVPHELHAVLEGAYDALFGPQDRVIERADRALGQAIARPCGVRFEGEVRAAWNDIFSTATLVNLGLSTQLVVLAALLAGGRPFAYAWLVLAQGVYAVCVWLLRAVRFRAYLRSR